MRVTGYELFEVPPRWQLLRLETDTGLVGWGEPIVEGRPDATRGAVRTLLEEYVLDKDPTQIEDHWQTMYRRGFYRRGAVLLSALSGVDQALWDLTGKQRDLPVYELLGGSVRDRIRIYQHVHGDSPEAVARAAEAAVDEGFTALKTTPTEAMRRIDAPEAVHNASEYVGAIREAVGPGVDVGLDFHGRVSKSMAKRLVEVLDEHEPMFYEEPVLPETATRSPKSPPAPRPRSRPASDCTRAGSSGRYSSEARWTCSSPTSPTPAESPNSGRSPRWPRHTMSD